MGIRSKPKQTSEPAIPSNEQQISALIDKGGTVAPRVLETSKPMLVQLRLPRNLISRIDLSRKTRTVAPSRHAWILEAILDKLKEESK